MRIILVRHGDIPDPAVFGTSLTELGVQQAIDNARKIGRMDWATDFIYTSPYVRCWETARILSMELHLEWYKREQLSEVGKNETLEDAQKRAVDWLNIMKRIDKNMIVVSHGGPLQGMALSLGHPTGACDRGSMLEFNS